MKKDSGLAVPFPLPPEGLGVERDWQPEGTDMRTGRLLVWLTVYYLGLSAALLGLFFAWPQVASFLPIGGVEHLIAQPAGGGLLDPVRTQAREVGNLAEGLAWLSVAILGALLAALPVSWTYIEVRDREEYDQSLVETIVVLPMVVTGIVIVVQNSLALAFSLAGIAAGVQFRNALRRPGDALFILLAIAIGLSAGMGAVELAIVMSIAFNYCFLILWINDYGARKGGQRFLRKNRDREPSLDEDPARLTPQLPQAGPEQV